MQVSRIVPEVPAPSLMYGRRALAKSIIFVGLDVHKETIAVALAESGERKCSLTCRLMSKSLLVMAVENLGNWLDRNEEGGILYYSSIPQFDGGIYNSLKERFLITYP